MSRLIRFLAIGFLVTFVASTASAQTISYGEAIDQLMAACGSDVEKHCKDVRLGAGRIQTCLTEHSNEISQQCKATWAQAFASLAQRAKAQAAAPELCKADAKRLCSDFNEGRARILRCLIRKETARNVSGACNQAITDAGWR